MEEEDCEDMDEQIDTKVAEDMGTFDAITVWSHGSIVDEVDDPYARAIQEWLGLAEAVSIDHLLWNQQSAHQTQRYTALSGSMSRRQKHRNDYQATHRRV